IVPPAQGLMVYCTNCGTNGEAQLYNGAAWVTLLGGTAAAASGPTPNVINPTTNKVWMDRNLGATQVATSSTDADSYGDLYQWGRGADGHQLRESSQTTTQSATDTPGDALFITESNDWRSTQNDNLWQGVNGINNPCPSGYRLPTETEWTAEIASWGSDNDDADGAFVSPLKLPMAGRRFISNGSLHNAGTHGFYWSSTVSSTKSRFLDFNSSTANMNSNYRASGYAVRCLKD
ncbi:FISUMP domain-containing protein, partial [Nonlabens sp.]|uniref:FISUMP domain-containing protein n=1 Tax=Nonlabens sp. TaxID=1888209 RepID=UPI00262BE8D5